MANTRARRTFRHHRTLEEELADHRTDQSFIDRYRVNPTIFYRVLDIFETSGMANKTRRSRAIENGVQVGPKIKRLYNYNLV